MGLKSLYELLKNKYGEFAPYMGLKRYSGSGGSGSSEFAPYMGLKSDPKKPKNK